MGNNKRRDSRDLSRGNGSSSMTCCLSSLVVFVLILGVAFGLIFGLIPIEEIRTFFGAGNDNDTGNTNEIPTLAPVEPAPYTFMQCPDKGDCCNGLESNCDLTPGEMLWPTVHNAMHDDFLGNNRAPLEKALEDGYRGLLLDVCWCENRDTNVNELVFCHGLCAVGRRDFDTVFPNMNTFLNENPTETILINFEISVGNPTPSEIWAVMSQFQGIPKKTYLHSGDTFPTMKELQDNNKQILLFKHNGVNCDDVTSSGCTGRILEFHKYALETDYSFPDPDDIVNYPNSCVGTRGLGSTKDFYHINHFVTKSIGASKNAAEQINQKEVLESRIEECEKVTNLVTSMVSVDFWQEGDLLEVAQEINKNRAKKRRSLRKRVFDWLHE